jgi:MATE family multidrug resistance protein
MTAATTHLSAPGVAHELRATFALAFPLIVGQLATIGENVVGLILAGHLGAHVLGVVAVGGSVWGLGIMGMIGTMMALSPSVAQLDGARRRHEVAPLFRQSLWLALALGILVQLLLYTAGPLLVGSIGIDPALLEDTDAYLHAVSFAAPPLAIYLACRGLSEGLSLTRPSMLFSLLGLVALAPIGYVLMYPLDLGAYGAGLSITLVCWLQTAAFAIFLRLSPAYRNLGWDIGRSGPDPDAIRALLRIGAPMAFAVLMEAALFSAAALEIGRFGEAAVAGHQVALSVASATFMVPLGLAMAITVRVGNAVGRNDAPGIRRAGLSGIALTLISQTISCALMLAFPAQIASIYSDDPAVLHVGVTLLYLAALFQFSDGIQVASNGALRGLKDARVPMLITVISYWGIGMPVGWFLAFPQGWQASGMWVGLIFALTVAATLLFLRFFALSRRAVRRRIVVRQQA